MTAFAPDQLAQWTGGRWTSRPAAALTTFGCDTRKLKAGDVFVALKTEKRDGHDFLSDAAAAGASAALVAIPVSSVALPQLVVEDPLAALQAVAREHRRAFKGPVIGISGSAGKTSTKDLLTLLLGGASCGVVATEGNLNNYIGVPLTLTRIDPARHAFAVIEAGISEPGEMALLAGMIEPDVAIITLVAPAHTEELGGIDGVAREKSLLPASVRERGVAIFPDSVAAFAPFQALRSRVRIVARTEGSKPPRASGDRVAFSVQHRGVRTVVALPGHGEPSEFEIRRVSDGMAQNVALAITTARWLGVPDSDIRSRLVGWKSGKLRGEIRELDGRLLYLDCYNANPASMADALETFVSIAPPESPRLFIIGCMEELGAEAAAHHLALGRSLPLRVEDHLFVIGTHAHDVCAGLLQKGDFTRQLQIVSTLDPVSTFLAEWHGTVFVKGSRRYQLEKVLEVQTSFPLPC